METIIIGGGASGLIAAIYAKRNGEEVTILEGTDRIGKKILMTGNGKCNITNEEMNLNCFRGNKELITNVLNKFSYKQTLEFFSDLGIMFKNKNGYVYPLSNQASSILEVLKMECEFLKINIIYDFKVKNILPLDNGINGYIIESQKDSLNCKKLIIATGGMSYPKTGSDGSGYILLKKIGVKINPVYPALCGLKSNNVYCSSLKGVRNDGKVSLYIDGKNKCFDIGEIQFTDYGISGIPVFQISRYAVIALNNKKQVSVGIDFLPDMTFDNLVDMLKLKINRYPFKNIEQQLEGIVNKKISQAIRKKNNMDINEKSKNLSLYDIKKIANILKNFNFDIVGYNDFNNAQICCGGVDSSQINKATLETNMYKNMYIIGELIDVDGICGGYNLQWAWSTGYIAGNSKKNSVLSI